MDTEMQFGMTALIMWIFFGVLAGIAGMFFPERSPWRMFQNVPAGIIGALVGGLLGWRLHLYPSVRSWAGVLLAAVGAAVFVLCYNGPALLRGLRERLHARPHRRHRAA
jgi:uncharacterized membrane protein YeaQ/YmgE (transglycosylase-associated protein family)